MAWFREETRRIKIMAQPHKPAAPAGLVLRGRIVTMDAGFNVIGHGLLIIEGNRIVHSAHADQPLPPQFAGYTVIDTGGTIYPGLFELHNHPSYNAIPLWEVPSQFTNRNQWRENDNYRRRVTRPASLLTHDPTSENARAVIRFVESRALLGGVTTTQGLSLYGMHSNTKAAFAGLVRNVESPDDKTWPVAEDQIFDFKSHDQANKKYGHLLGDTRYSLLMHLSEGTDDDARAVFEFLQRPDGSWLIDRNLIGIHGTALNAGQWATMAASGGIVWSPLSNLLLYGETTNVKAAAAEGLPIALGSDWGPSGTKNLLGELKIAKVVSEHLGGLFADRELVRMVTSAPANMMGWGGFLGSLEIGKIADCLVIEGTSKDPWTQLIETSETDIVAILINGRPRAGRATLIDPATPGVEMIRIAKQDIVLDLVETSNHPLAATTLASAISTLSYSLEHLPDLAERFLSQHSLMAGVPDRFYVHLDTDEGYAKDLMAGTARIGPGDVDPMVLDPITEADDDLFRERLRANINIPEWLRSGL
ncbi:amidohydrolase family protein [Mesorhizobium sp.]|uniref:amidohydrolase family protein n=1 Tax=Mesorhizobium sp. TaxID=1871066 RepID=UPI001219C605|nr:amidohydrolase family protein [Mesorhizobium sp.]TIL65610.1 MAG: amidohydrolase [Mesorhizobium sp.]